MVVTVAASFGGATADAEPSPSPKPPPSTSPSISPDVLGLPAGFSSWSALFEAQEPLDKAATAIEDATNAQGDSGFTSDYVDAATHSITLHWHGRPTAAESAVIDAAPQQRNNYQNFG